MNTYEVQPRAGVVVGLEGVSEFNVTLFEEDVAYHQIPVGQCGVHLRYLEERIVCGSSGDCSLEEYS